MCDLAKQIPLAPGAPVSPSAVLRLADVPYSLS